VISSCPVAPADGTGARDLIKRGTSRIDVRKHG
jgi:hypothetical protein